MDFIQIALNNYTDFVKFEQLSIEIAALEGYTNIKKIGGLSDDGIDAESAIYQGADLIKKTVFQFSIQKNVKSKIDETIEKLQKNRIPFDELVFVTKHLVNNIQELRSSIRLKYNGTIALEILDQVSLIKNLSLRRDIFLRYFPNIKSQLESDFFQPNTFFGNSESILKRSMLKCTLMFSLNDTAKQRRKDLFDKTLLSIIVSHSKSSLEQIKECFKTHFKRIIDDSQLSSSIDRLIKSKYIIEEKSFYIPTKEITQKISTNIAAIESKTNALISDIIERTSEIYSQRIPSHIEQQIEFNIKKTLNMFFKLYGADYINNDIFVNEINCQKDLLDAIKENLPSEIGTALTYSFAEMFSKPTSSQSEVLALWAKAFIGTQIMSLDPLLREFQTTKMKNKTFILDTDFVLYCITDYCKLSILYKILLNELLNTHCSVYIPKEVILEVIKHAEFAKRNYNYFKNTFDVIDDFIVEEKMQNIFVKDFYLQQKSKAFSNSFDKYISNYYEPSDPYRYMLEVIEEKLPEKVIIAEEKVFNANIPDVIKRKLENEIYDETIKTEKSSYRTPDENYEIAKTDAYLYLSASYLNEGSPSDLNKNILIGSHYLVTNSTRAIRCSKTLSLYKNVVTKPQTLVSLFSEIGIFEPSKIEYINLFENPFLAEVLDQNWETVKCLMDMGVDLKGENIPRLQRDLDYAIHNALTLNNEKNNSGYVDTTNDDSSSMNSYFKLIKEIHDKGYKFVPQVDNLISIYEKQEKDLIEKNQTIEKLKEEYKIFNRRRQKYLNKIKK